MKNEQGRRLTMNRTKIIKEVVRLLVRQNLNFRFRKIKIIKKS